MYSTHPNFRPTRFGNRPIWLPWRVGNSFWDIQPNSSGSVGGSLHLNPISTNPTNSTTNEAASPPYIRFLSWISPDSAWFYRGQAKSLWDSARSSHTRPVLGQICRISARSAQFSARSGEFWPNLTPTETQPLPMKNRPIQPDSFTGRRRVWMLVTRLGRVGCGLDTNPTRTNPWSPLIMHVNMSPLYFGCYLGMSK